MEEAKLISEAKILGSSCRGEKRFWIPLLDCQLPLLDLRFGMERGQGYRRSCSDFMTRPEGVTIHSYLIWSYLVGEVIRDESYQCLNSDSHVWRISPFYLIFSFNFPGWWIQRRDRKSLFLMRFSSAGFHQQKKENRAFWAPFPTIIIR